MGQILPPERALTRARALAKRGDNDAARAILIDVARRHPHNKRLRKALVMLDMPATPPRPPGVAGQVRELGALCEGGRFDEAIALAGRLLEVLPGDPIVLTYLGAALLESGRAREALAAFETVIRAAPTFARAWTGFATALSKLDRHHQAVRAFSQALSLAPVDVDALNGLGSSLRGLNRHEEALACFEKVIALKDGPKARKNYGTTLMELGRAEEAQGELRRALDMDPDYCAAHRDLSLVRRYAPGDAHIGEMERLAARGDLSLNERAQLAFGLAKAYDDVDERARAFAAWQEGNALRQREVGYDAAREARRFELLARLFREHTLSPLAFEPIPWRPIFIVGMPRSGTSLCEQILSRHPAVWGAGELEDIRIAVAQASEANGRRLCHASVREIRARYVAALREIQAPHGVVTDKMPSNFRFVGFIRLAFPEARIIHMRRDPVAVCWSLFRSYFAIKGHGYAYDLTDAADYFALYHALMELYEALWPDAIHPVAYEALTEDPQGQIRALLAACALPFDPACLEAHRSTRAVRTVSALQVRSAIYKGSSQAWRRYEPFLQPMIDRLASHGLGPAAA